MGYIQKWDNGGVRRKQQNLYCKKHCRCLAHARQRSHAGVFKREVGAGRTLSCVTSMILLFRKRSPELTLGRWTTSVSATGHFSASPSVSVFSSCIGAHMKDAECLPTLSSSHTSRCVNDSVVNCNLFFFFLKSITANAKTKTQKF